MDIWRGNIPVIIIPTKYYQTKTDHFEKKGIKMIIWANHLIRSLITHLETVAKKIHTEKSVVSIEPHIAPLSQLFDYQDIKELEETEKKYSQNPHPPKDESFGIIPVNKENQQWKVFIIKHKKGGHWGFPKGHKSFENEEQKKIAERELFEETGLRVKSFLPIDVFSVNYFCTSHEKYVHKTVSYFTALVHGTIALCPHEASEGMWLDIDQVFEKINFPEMQPIIDKLQNALKQYDLTLEKSHD